MKTSLWWGGVVGLALAILGWGHFESGSAQQTSKVTKEKEKDDAGGKSTDAERAADEKAIIASAEKFRDAFNAHDAKAAAAQFLPKAEYLNSDGEAFAGREAIEKDLADYFKSYPKSKIAMEINSIRFVGPRVAIEEGRTEVTHEPDTTPVRQSYIAVDLLVDGEWQLASVRELAEEIEEEPATPHDHLQPLAFLVGDWVDESESGIAETHCRWTDDGNYLIQDFHLKIAGNDLVSGQQRIGWDPLTGQVKSWVFDSTGGYSEGLWTDAGTRWIIKASGVKSDGTTASATNILTQISNDSYSFESTSRISRGELGPDAKVVVVRRPPPPGEKPAKGKPVNAKPAEKK